MSVIKSRASHDEPGIRQFLIGPDGIVLADGLPIRSVPHADPENPGKSPRHAPRPFKETAEPDPFNEVISAK